MRLLPTPTATPPGGDSDRRIDAERLPDHSRHCLVASDFDQTLSFNDSGEVLSELLGRPGFADKVRGLAGAHLVQQGGELAYLLLHDPEYRCVRREHLAEVGRRIRLKRNIDALIEILEGGINGHRFSFFVISAAPEEVVRSALEGIVPPQNIHGTRFSYDEDSGEIRSVERLTAGYGKVAVLDELQARLQVPADRIIYVGDGSSDIHVMLHVNRRNGFTIAVSENKHIAPIARRTVLSDNALSVLVPILEDVVDLATPAQVRGFFEARGLAVQEWDKMQVDVVTFRDGDLARGSSLHDAPASARFG
ncbi:HAD-IB family phosphatase [Tautonia plasticadhaerens]|uniref:phosphoserine phosphatase n=1 Tax=Tautonia plasticadhaerens TaxID=2527974 RepID=A0A518HBI5_9BACT|nr:HAD-IB family phosphatase [Tautonia plasticadhaerens]QDV38222.1 haloacid dehalogenase-like hydrolase [Tautonia plasticadhaerens]